VSATNPDTDDPTILSAYNLPAGASFDPDLGSFVWTPSTGQGPAVYTVTFKAVETGPNSFSDVKTVTINVDQSSSSVQPSAASKLVPVLIGAGAIVLISVLGLTLTVRARRKKKGVD
jgi:putative Ig domain-containing protein